MLWVLCLGPHPDCHTANTWHSIIDANVLKGSPKLLLEWWIGTLQSKNVSVIFHQTNCLHNYLNTSIQSALKAHYTELLSWKTRNKKTDVKHVQIYHFNKISPNSNPKQVEEAKRFYPALYTVHNDLLFSSSGYWSKLIWKLYLGFFHLSPLIPSFWFMARISEWGKNAVCVISF